MKHKLEPVKQLLVQVGVFRTSIDTMLGVRGWVLSQLSQKGKGSSGFPMFPFLIIIFQSIFHN